MPRPAGDAYPPFYDTYVRLVPEEDLSAAFSRSVHELENDLSRIPENMGDHAYAAGKWTIRELLQHAIDTERIFAYRALCIARGEKQALPGFDENAYAREAGAGHVSLSDLKEELLLCRRSTVRLFRGFPEKAMERTGTANGQPISVLALGYIMIGHWRHHKGVIEERYI
jgi:hypothetical protein